MGNKSFTKVPNGKFDRIVYSGHLSEALGNEFTKSQLKELIDKQNLVLTDEQKEIIKEEFSIAL